MDLSGIPKLSYRSRLMNAYHVVTGSRKIPHNEVFFTLAGPNATSEYSELNQLTREGFITRTQYVSAERDTKIHNVNRKIKGPTWIQGEIEPALNHYYSNNPRPIAFLNADLMSGIDTVMTTINEIVEEIYTHNATTHSKNIIMAFNVIESFRWAENRGRTFSPVLETIRHNHKFQSNVREFGIKLIDDHSYENKTVGTGKGISRMRTLIYTMPLP